MMNILNNKVSMLQLITGLVIIQNCYASYYLRPEYGLKYTEEGSFYQGIKRYYLVVGIQVPKIAFTAQIGMANLSWSVYTACSVIKDNTLKHAQEQMSEGLYNFGKPHDLLVEVCNVLQPALEYGALKEKQYQEELERLANVDIASVIRQYKSKDFVHFDNYDQTSRRKRREIKKRNTKVTVHQKNNTSKVRKKRFIFNLISNALSLTNTIIQKKKNKAMRKAISHLQDDIESTNNNVQILRQQMTAIVKTTFSSYKKLVKEINQIQFKITQIERHIIRYEEFNHITYYSIKMVADILAKMIGWQERNLSLYQQLKGELHDFLSALDSLSTKHLSHTIISPYHLEQYITEAQADIRDNYPDYQLALHSINQYYDLPLIEYRYAGNNTIAVQIPLLMKPKEHPSAKMYRIDTVKVPYNLDRESGKAGEDKDFTQLKLNYDMLAIQKSGYKYLTFKHEELGACTHFDRSYFCENVFLIRERIKENCETALFYNETAQVIRKLCNFEYYSNIQVEPRILSTDKELLLANVPLPWKFECEEGYHQDDKMTGHPYAVIDKGISCHCKVKAGEYEISRDSQYCHNRDRPPTISYTANAAVYLQFSGSQRLRDLIPEFSNAIQQFHFQKPTRYLSEDIVQFPDPKIIEDSQDEDMVESAMEEEEESNAFALTDIMNFLTDDANFYTVTGKLGSITDVSTWFDSSNSIFGVLFVGFIITLIIAVIVAILGLVIYKHRKQVVGLGTRIPQLAGLIEAVKSVGVKAQEDDYFAQKEDYFYKEGLKYINLSEIEQLAHMGIDAEIYQPPKELWHLTWGLVSQIMVVELAMIIVIYMWYRLIRFLYYRLTLTLWDKGDIWSKRISNIYLTMNSFEHGYTHLYLGSIISYPNEISAKGELKIKNLSVTRRCFSGFMTIQWQRIRLYHNNSLIFPGETVYIPWHKMNKISNILRDQYATVVISTEYGREWHELRDPDETIQMHLDPCHDNQAQVNHEACVYCELPKQRHDLPMAKPTGKVGTPRPLVISPASGGSKSASVIAVTDDLITNLKTLKEDLKKTTSQEQENELYDEVA